MIALRNRRSPLVPGSAITAFIVIIVLVIAMTGVDAMTAPALSRSGGGNSAPRDGGTILLSAIAFLGLFFGYFALRILIAARGLIWEALLKKLGIRR